MYVITTITYMTQNQCNPNFRIGVNGLLAGTWKL